jgi:hypothetical protein
MSKLFLYRFADGAEIETADMTTSFYRELVDLHGECLYNGFRDQLSSLTLLRANSHKTKTDGFQPGWHPALGMEIRTNGQYQAELKARGMVEVGNEKQNHKKKETKVFTEEVIKDAIDSGAELSGNEVKKLLGEQI